MGLKSDLVTVQELAKASGVSVATVDHYVDIGLLKITKREGTKRLFEYSPSVEKIEEIRGLLSQGFLLKEIRRKIINGDNHQKDLPISINRQRKYSIFKKFFKKRFLVLFLIISGTWAVFYLTRTTRRN